MSEESDSRMATFLNDHPRMMGALFTLLLLLSQVGMAAADGGAASGYPGP